MPMSSDTEIRNDPAGKRGNENSPLSLVATERVIQSPLVALAAWPFTVTRARRTGWPSASVTVPQIDEVPMGIRMTDVSRGPVSRGAGRGAPGTNTCALTRVPAQIAATTRASEIDGFMSL